MNLERAWSRLRLKPQDILVLLKLISHKGDWTYRSLSHDLSMSIGEVHNALDRASKANLFDADERQVQVQALEEFLVHGLKYVFPSKRGSITRGIPTSYAAPPLNRAISRSNTEPPPVWSDPKGTVRGYKLEPLYASVPKAAKKDKGLYELLALVDAIRDGRARERKLAYQHLHMLLEKYHEKA